MTKPVTKKEQSLHDLAHTTLERAVGALTASRRGLLEFASYMKLIQDQKLWKPLGYSSFEALCCESGGPLSISLKPKTVQEYIGIYEYWIEKQKKKVDEMAGIEYNKLVLLKKVKKPERYFEDARLLGYKDLKIKVKKQEFGIPEPEEEEQEKKEHRHDNSCDFASECPFRKQKQSPKGVDVKLALAKPARATRIGAGKKTDDDLI